MVNNIIRRIIIEFKYYFLTIYLDLLSKDYLQSNLYLQELYWLELIIVIRTER